MAGAISVADGPRIFRGWWVLAGIFVVMTTGSGFAFYAQGVFLDALVLEQGFSVSLASAGTGVFFLTSGIGGYFAGGLMSRFDVRAVICFGATVAAAGILLLGQIRNTWQMFAVFLLYGAGYALAGLVPATSLVTRWFHVRRSIALSIASTGLSVGGFAITPVLAKLIDDRSLVDVAPQFAIAYWLGVVPVTLLLLRPSPESAGLLPDGAPILSDAPAAPPVGVPFATAIRTRYFRLMSAGFILIMGAQVGALQHLFKLTKDTVDLSAAQLVLTVMTATSVGARLLGGIAATRIPLARLASILIVVQAAGIVIIGSSDQRGMIVLGVVVLALAMGNLLMLHPLLLADAFGVAHYPRIYGLASLLMITGVGLGPFLVGVTRDAASYRTAFYFAAGAALIGLLVFRFAGQPDQSWASTTAGRGSATTDPEPVSDPAHALVVRPEAAPPIDDLIDDLDPVMARTRMPAVLSDGPPRPPAAHLIGSASASHSRPPSIVDSLTVTVTASDEPPIRVTNQRPSRIAQLAAAGSLAATVAMFLWMRGRSAGRSATKLGESA